MYNHDDILTEISSENESENTYTHYTEASSDNSSSDQERKTNKLSSHRCKTDQMTEIYYKKW